MAPGGNRADVQNARAKLVESYNQILEEFNTDQDLKNVGNYRISRMIGKGSFGKVYLATHKLTGTKVVLKSAEKSDLNLAREIHHYRQLLHPHIARLYEVVITETLVWLVLEYCPGDELYTYVLRHGRLSTDQVQRIFAQLCGAVAYIHTKNIVHRDLKLENILMDKHDRVKLCDFGFTRECEPKRLLQTFCGTICYAAPEMVLGEKYHGQAVDVWALGIILYALLCGELPFDEEDEVQTRLRISNDDPDYPDFLPEDALNLLQSILSKRSSTRPSATEILQHPFLSQYSGEQISQLLILQPPPFSTKLERDILDRLRHAYIDIDAMRESVLQQKCDNLAGWWALIVEHEQRKSKRSKKKRRSERYKRSTEGSLSRRASTETAIPLQKPVHVEDPVDESTQTLEETIRSQAEEAANAPAPSDGGHSEGATSPRRRHRSNLFREIVDVLAHPKQWGSASGGSGGPSGHLRSGERTSSSSRRPSISSFLSLHKSQSPASDHHRGGLLGRNSPVGTGGRQQQQKPAGDASKHENRSSPAHTASRPTSADQAAAASAATSSTATAAGTAPAVGNGVQGLSKPASLSRSLTDGGEHIRRDRSSTRNRSSLSSLRMTGMHSSDSRRSVSLDRHSSPNSGRVRRGISRTSTSSSFSSLRSSNPRRSTFSRKSSTSSNSISSMNTSRSPRSSLRYNPSTPTVSDGFDHQRRRPKFSRHRRSSNEDDNSSVSSRSTATASFGTPRPMYASTQQQRAVKGRFSNEAVFYKSGSGRNFSADTFFNEPTQPRRRMMGFRSGNSGVRGRKGVPEDASEPALYRDGTEKKDDGGDGIEAVDEEGEYSDEEGADIKLVPNS
ncbi:serine/threonine protein kinase [Myxozyma melibiosi]|uniref:Serine/threonine protein kinase n=1 Tax=Myxozyma melibiosi TaxID=54550 RepID=A0ABR1F5P4_9ASCO